VRAPAVLLALGTGLVGMRLSLDLFASRRAAFLAAALGASLPLYSAGSMLMTIDAPLLTADVLKGEVGRLRPGRTLAADPELAAGRRASFSFPSGAATNAFAAISLWSVWHPELAVPLFAAGGLIAYSRVYVGEHYPADVVRGPFSVASSGSRSRCSTANGTGDVAKKPRPEGMLRTGPTGEKVSGEVPSASGRRPAPDRCSIRRSAFSECPDERPLALGEVRAVLDPDLRGLLHRVAVLRCRHASFRRGHVIRVAVPLPVGATQALHLRRGRPGDDR
jgi:hypothetical protein